VGIELSSGAVLSVLFEQLCFDKLGILDFFLSRLVLTRCVVFLLVVKFLGLVEFFDFGHFDVDLYNCR
jgi:hypothetical protein